MATGALGTSVLVDANVWYSRTLRDWICLCYLEQDGWFEVKWTEDILAEVVYHLRKDRPTAPEPAICGVRDRLTEIFSTGRINGYAINEGIDYPDIGDAHVHAAAEHGGVDILVTADAGFGDLDELTYEIHTPDSFLCLLEDSASNVIQAVVIKQLEYWTARGGPFNLVGHLRKAGAPDFAERIRGYLQACENVMPATPGQSSANA